MEINVNSHYRIDILNGRWLHGRKEFIRHFDRKHAGLKTSTHEFDHAGMGL